MMGLLKSSEPMIAVQDDPAVRQTAEAVLKARARLDQAEADERRLVRIVTGTDNTYSDQEYDDARQRLAVIKGTQAGWYLPEAEEARQAAKNAEQAHLAAAQPAKARLLQAGEATLAALTKELNAALEPARRLAAEIEAVRQEMSDGGVKPPAHPCSALLPDGTVDFQLRIVRERGWI